MIRENEQERQTIRKRQREGIEIAKVQGKHLGRPAKKPEDWDTASTLFRLSGLDIFSVSAKNLSTSFLSAGNDDLYWKGKIVCDVVYSGVSFVDTMSFVF